MREMDYGLVEKLTQTSGPISCESEVSKLIESVVKPYADEVYYLPFGSLIALKKGCGKGKRVAVAAHMDEIGLIVNKILDNGFLRVSAVGYPFPVCTLGQRVRFTNGTPGVVGVDGELAGRGGSDPDIKDITFEKLYVDIGASSAQEAAKLVSVGDECVFCGYFYHCGDGLLSKALDNRLGTYTLIEALRSLEGKKPYNDFYAIFSVGEEINSYGAITATYGIEPDVMYAVDVTVSDDIPESSAGIADMKLGKGPALKIMDMNFYCQPRIKRLMLDTAKEAGISCQMDVLDFAETDICATQFVKDGVLCGALSMATRCIHTPIERASVSDTMATAELFARLADKNMDDYLGTEGR